MTPSEAAAAARIRRALELIEEAQGLLSRAGERLSPVRGLAKEWSRVRRLYEQVRASWYRIEYRLQRGGFALDDQTQEQGSGISQETGP